MEANEIMLNDEVMEVTEDIVKTGSGKGFKVAAGVGAIVLVGGLAYKYVIKPTIAKIKAKKETDRDVVEVNSTPYQEDTEDFDSEED